MMERVKEKSLGTSDPKRPDNRRGEDEEMERQRRRWNVMDVIRILDKAGKIAMEGNGTGMWYHRMIGYYNPLAPENLYNLGAMDSNICLLVSVPKILLPTTTVAA